jgi:hypothetical protein
MIPFPQSAHRVSDESSLAKSILAAIPRAYAVVFYSTDVRFGWALLALSLLVPQVGLAGLLGVLLAALPAWQRATAGQGGGGALLGNGAPAATGVTTALPARINRAAGLAGER